MQGYLFIDKQPEWTSHDVVAKLRGITKIKKIGHAGTLDPFATGLLIVGVGRAATKHLDDFHLLPKTYLATVHLGQTSTTYDTEGEITDVDLETKPSEQEILDILESMTGLQDQLPPIYSAKKINGQKMYDLARKGIEIERKPHQITIHEIKLISYNYPDIEIEVTCSTGTYIRTIAHDIGEKLNTGAYCSKLRRTSIGNFIVDNTKSLDEISSENVKGLLQDAELILNQIEGRKK